MVFYCLFSYHSLLELHYRDKLHKSQSAREWAREVGLSIRVAEWHLDAKLFLYEYPRWEIDGPHCSVILHDMFLSAAKQGQNEVERFVQQGHWQSLPRLDPEADAPTIKLVGAGPPTKRSETSHTAYLATMERGGNLRHPVLSEELFA